LNRIAFYDRDSNCIEKQLTETEKALYLKEIQKDITYFNRTYKRADLSVDLSGLAPEPAAIKVKELLDQTGSEARGTPKKGMRSQEVEREAIFSRARRDQVDVHRTSW
jgi:hypothetical protein